MSELEKILRDAFADSSVDFISAGRTQQGDFFASIKRCGRGYGVHYAKDPGEALLKALTTPDGVGRPDVAFRTAKAAAVAAGRILTPSEPALAPIVAKPAVPVAPAAPAVDEDLFG